MFPQKIPIIIPSCKSEVCSDRNNDILQTWFTTLDKNKYHLIFIDGDKNISRQNIITHEKNYSKVTLKVRDDFEGLSEKMKFVFSFVLRNINSPHYWFADNDSYINTKIFNIFSDYNYDWYGNGPWTIGSEFSTICGCGFYMSKYVLQKVSEKLSQNFGHFYDVAIGDTMKNDKNIKIKYNNKTIIHRWHEGVDNLDEKSRNDMMIGHRVFDMVKFHSLYK